jgi:hypothetical protein
MDNSTQTEPSPRSIPAVALVTILALPFLLGVVLGTWLGVSVAEAKLRQQAVQAGCGEYVITDVMTGKTEFQFKGGK